MKSIRNILMASVFACTLLFGSLSAMAQAAGAPPPEANPMAGQPKADFMNIVIKGDPKPINQIIWLLLLGVSIATFAQIIDAAMQVKREKLIPFHLVDGVRSCLQEGDLEGAIATCEENPGPLSNILLAGFSQITEGFAVIQETIVKASELETEKIMQKLNFLNIYGQMGPMLGLLGTVTGMVAAFNGLATMTGAGKAAMLAISIAGALWTTIAGLLISIPALLGFTIFRNQAIKIIIETEQTVIDLIKTLRNAEVAKDAE